jgi:hypothetical protein
MNVKGRAILEVYRAGQTVFSIEDLALLWRVANPDITKNRISYYVRTGQLFRLKRGIYARDKAYDKHELGVKIFSPAYVSLETVLAKHGVIFQYYESIFLASSLSRSIEVDGQNFVYRTLKSEILLNPEGIDSRGNYNEASLERGFLDYIYLFKDIYLDNLEPINWQRCRQLLSVYSSRALAVRMEKYAGQK